MSEKHVIFGVIIFISFTIEATSGFGSIVIAVTLGSLFLPIKSILPVLAGLNIFLGVYILSRYFRYIDGGLLFKRILPFMVIGTVGGIVIFTWFHNEVLKFIFGVLVMVFSLRELFILLIQKKVSTTEKPMWLTSLLMVMAGVTHGMYASGGPLLVYSLTGLNREKRVFRATLSAVWLALNALLVGYFFTSGQFTPVETNLLLLFLPIIVLAIASGEWLHHRINERNFKITVFLVLFAASAALLL